MNRNSFGATPICVLILLIIFSGCSTTQNQPLNTQSTPKSQPGGVLQTLPAYHIQPGDQLDIKFYYNQELNESIIVRPDGKISLQLIGDLAIAGLTAAEVRTRINEQYDRELKEPQATVIVKSFTGQQVYVGGEVNSPGLVALTAGLNPLQAIINSGGLKDTAKLGAVIVIRKGDDNKPVPHVVNLKKAMYGGLDMALQSSDVVYVPKKTISKVNQFVNQYIYDLVKFQGLSFSYF